LCKEILAGRVAGPFIERPIATLRVSPLGLIPKKDGDYRLIHHLTHPKGSSVNDFVDPELCSVQYASIDQAIAAIQRLGPGTMLAKSDIRQAFRLLPVIVSDHDLLGFRFDGNYFVDK
jgi:hypothetical protein